MAGKKRGRPKGSKNKVQPGQIILSVEPVKKKDPRLLKNGGMKI